MLYIYIGSEFDGFCDRKNEPSNFIKNYLGIYFTKQKIIKNNGGRVA